MKKEILIADNIDNIYDEINALIREKKTDVKKVVNDAIISLNWRIGKRLSAEFTGNNKPEYGKKLLQKSVNDWNRSMVLDLIRHQFQE